MLIRQIMRQRRLWVPAQGDPSHAQTEVDYATRTCSAIKGGGSVHFLWTQYRVKDFFDAMAKMQSCKVTKNNEHKLELSAKGTTRDAMMHNHFEGNGHLCSKRGLHDSWVALFKEHSLDPFDTFPLTFVVRSDDDDEFKAFEEAYSTCAETKKFVWIVKPGDFSNRGCGIRVYDSLENIRTRIRSKDKCWVIQKYLERPLLVHKRKFDIRSYCLVDMDLKAYFYEDAYLRTTSEEWNLDDVGNKFAHLNNDAVQKNGANYGKFESANKLNLDEFQKYITSIGYNVSVEEDIVPQMKDRMRDCMAATHTKLNPQNLTCFEVYGFDFMIDDSFSVWLIEVNTNPCLEQCNSHLSRLIPAMLEDAFALTIDKLFHGSAAPREEPKTKWQLIFDPSKDDGRVSSPSRPLSERPGIESILEGPVDPFRGRKKLVKTAVSSSTDAKKSSGSRRVKSKETKDKVTRETDKVKTENDKAKKGKESEKQLKTVKAGILEKRKTIA